MLGQKSYFNVQCQTISSTFHFQMQQQVKPNNSTSKDIIHHENMPRKCKKQPKWEENIDVKLQKRIWQFAIRRKFIHAELHCEIDTFTG